MTEDEANTKWCPFVRAVPLGATQNYGKAETLRDFNRPNSRNCIASACMAWRTRPVWVQLEKREADESPGPEWSEGLFEREWVREELRPSGYCGLAGAPQ